MILKKLSSTLKPYSKIETLRHGHNILLQGEIPRSGYLILDGMVASNAINQNGDEQTVSLHGKGALLPLSWLNNESTTSLYYYSVLSDVRALVFSRSDFNTVINSDNEHLKEYTQFLAREYTAQTLRITGLGQARAIDKLCYLFYYLVFRYGVKDESGMYNINLRLNQSLIASLIGQTREGTARNIKELSEKGVISYESFSYSIDKARLERFIGEDNFRDLPHNL